MRTETKAVCIKIIIYIFCFVSFFQAMFLRVHIFNFELSVNRAILCLFLSLFCVEIMKKQLKMHIPNIFSYKFLFFWLFYAIALFPIAVTGAGISGWIKLVYLVLLYWLPCVFLSNYVYKLEDFINILYCFQSGIFIQAILGCYEHQTLDYHFLEDDVKYIFITVPGIVNKRLPCAMQGNPNDFAILMAIGVFISIACVKLSKNFWIRILHCLITGFYVYMIAVSDSRSGMLYLVLGMCYRFVSEIHWQTKAKTLRILLGIFVLAFLFIFFHYDDLISSISLFLDMRGSSDQKRLGIYLSGIKKLAKTFGLGTGYYIEALHCFWVEILCDFGVIIFAAFLMFYLRMILKMRKITKGNDKAAAAAATCFCQILIGFFLGSFGPASTLGIEWMGVIFAVMVVFERNFEENKRSLREDRL